MAKRELFCARCHAKVDVSSMRYDRKGEHLICKNCYNKGDEARGKSPYPGKQTIEVRDLRKNDSLYNKYICRQCRFNFKFREDSRQILRCPYCGSTDVEINKVTANDIIRQSTNPRYDF